MDVRKAFDSVKQYDLLAAIRKEGVSGKFAGAIRAMHNSVILRYNDVTWLSQWCEARM